MDMPRVEFACQTMESPTLLKLRGCAVAELVKVQQAEEAAELLEVTLWFLSTLIVDPLIC